jgi:DNA-binding NtrC family response regulator
LIENIRVLIADDDAEGARSLGQGLVRQGYFCELARTPAAALAIMARARCDVAICEVRVGSGAELQLLDRLKQVYPRLPVIVLTGCGTTDEAVEAIKHGRSSIWSSPVSSMISTATSVRRSPIVKPSS